MRLTVSAFAERLAMLHASFGLDQRPLTMQTRRNFFATLGVAALGFASRKAAAASELPAPPRSFERIGLQLYTVRDLMKADLPGTLAKVAAIGYKEVEFADYFGRTPAQIRELLLRNGLVSPSTHLPFESLQKGWQQTLDDANAIGHHWVTIPSVPDDKRGTLDDWKRHAALFNLAAAQAKSAGLRFAYHNHDYDLRESWRGKTSRRSSQGDRSIAGRFPDGPLLGGVRGRESARLLQPVPEAIPDGARQGFVGSAR